MEIFKEVISVRNVSIEFAVKLIVEAFAIAQMSDFR